MNIKFRQGSEEVSQKLIDRAQIKAMKLSRLMAEQKDEAQVYIDIERESGAHTNSESMWRASIILDHAGERFTIAETGKTPEKATDLALKELKQSVQRAHKKQKAVLKRGQGIVKRLRNDLIGVTA